MKEDENQDKEDNSAKKSEQNLETDYVAKYTVTGIINLFSQLIYKSPPLSAFIDYMVLLFHKAKQNSIEEFYKLLFVEKKYSQDKGEELDAEEEQVLNFDKDSISGKELKALYEKYCYLNELLERKFDDETNIKFLQRKGFKIVYQQDSQTQFFTRVKLNGTIAAVSETPGKTSLDLFFSSSCILTNFETDQIEASDLEKNYSEFCQKNHMTKFQFNETQMKREYGIESIHVSEQELQRDDKFDVQIEKKKYFIDKNRVENNFKIILTKDIFLLNLIYDSKEIQQAQRDIEVPTRWQLFDFITVIAHMITMIILGSPLLIIVIFIRIQQSAYSLYSPQHLISFETLLYYPISIPAKLIDDSWLIRFVVILTLVFWCLSFIDLIYYYSSMGFPQERYFNSYNQTAQKARKILTSIMWVIVLFSLYAAVMYVSLVAIWLMLGAIINPNAFLPYATSAATFVTLVAKKYKEFEEIYQNGFKTLSDYLTKLASEQIQVLLGKMNIQETIADIIPTDSIKSITAEASKLGIIDPSLNEEIQNNLEVMIRDPAAANKLGSELIKISQDPSAFTQQVTQKLEEKAKQMLSQSINSIEKEVKEQIINLLWCLLKNQKSEIKQTMRLFINSLITQYQQKNGGNLMQSIGKVNLKGPVFDFIWEFAFPQENMKMDYSEHITDVFCAALSNIIIVWNKQMKPQLVESTQLESKKSEKQTKKSKFNEEPLKNPQDILRERIQAELKSSEAVLQLERPEQEQIIILSSEEQIAFAYKKIIYSVIKIYKAINTGSSEEILDHLVLLGEHTSKLSGFESFALLHKFQDVFSLGFSVFKNPDKIQANDIIKAILGFIKNSGFEKEAQEITGFSVFNFLKIIGVIIESIKNQSNPQNISAMKKTVDSLIEDLLKESIQSKFQKKIFDPESLQSQEDCDKMTKGLQQSIQDMAKLIEQQEAQISKLTNQEKQQNEKQDYFLINAKELYEEAIKNEEIPNKIELISVKVDELITLIQSAKKIITKQTLKNEKKNEQKLDLDKQFFRLFSKNKKLIDQIQNEQTNIEKKQNQIDKFEKECEDTFQILKSKSEEKIFSINYCIRRAEESIIDETQQIREYLNELNDLVKESNLLANKNGEELEEEIQIENFGEGSDEENLNNFNKLKKYKGKQIRNDLVEKITKSRLELSKLKVNLNKEIENKNEAEAELEKEESNCEKQKSDKKESTEISKNYEQMKLLQQQKEKLVIEIKEVIQKQENLNNDENSTKSIVLSNLDDALEKAEESKEFFKQCLRVQEENIRCYNTLIKGKASKEKYEGMIQKIKVRSAEIAKEEKPNDNSNTIQKQSSQKNYFATGITLMLNFFTGELLNIPIETIWNFGLLLEELQKSESCGEIQKLSRIFIMYTKQFQSSYSDSKESLLMFQQIINLIDIFINDSMISVKNIEQNGLDLSINPKIVKPLKFFFTLKFNGLVKQSQINLDLKGTDLLGKLEFKLKIKQDVLIGLMEMIAGYKSSKEINNFIHFSVTQNKISELKVPTIHHLYNIYSSIDPSELYSALEYFMVAEEQQKNLESITLGDLVKVMLFMRGQIEFSFVQQIIEVKMKLDKIDEKEDSSKASIKDRLKKSEKFPEHWKKLLQIEHSGSLTIAALSQDFKIFNQNKSIILEGSDFKFIQKFISLRNISRFEDPTLTTIIKSSIEDISEILNVSFFALERFIILFTSNKQEQLLKAVLFLNLEDLDPQLKQKDLKTFIEYASTIQNKFVLRSDNIKSINKLFFSDQIPLSLLNRVLDNNNYELTYSDYLQIFKLNFEPNEIPRSISNLIDFRFGLSGSSFNDVYNFLNVLNEEEKEEETKKNISQFKEEKQRLTKAIQIISIDDESKRLKIFLQQLINEGQHILLLMSCFLVFFSGRSSNLILTIPDKGEIGPVLSGNKKKKVSVEQLISQILQIKSEFFESIHTLFQEDVVVSTRTMIKFFRQLDYLDQSSENKQIIDNNITISEKTVEQYIRLVSGMQFNTSFFAKESNIPIELIELVSSLQQIQKFHSFEERQIAYKELKNNQLIGKILSQLQVNPQELIVLITFMFSDYDPAKLKWISQSLKLPSNFPIDGLSTFITLDQTLQVFGDSKTNKKTLDDLIKGNQFLKNFKFDKNWVAIAYLLIKGDFTLLPEYQSKILALKYPDFRVEYFIRREDKLKGTRTVSQCVNADHDRYLDLIQGITGLLSCREKSIEPTKFFHQLYTKLNQTFWEEEGMTIDDGLRKGNTLDYAIYKFTKATQMSPLWTLLMMGDYNTWELLARKHFLTNQSLVKTTNPFIALVYVLCFRSCPIIAKQELIFYEFSVLSTQIILEKKKMKSDLKSASEAKDPSKSQKIKNSEKIDIDKYQEFSDVLKQKILVYLDSIIMYDSERLLEISESIGFPKRIINMLTRYNTQYELQKRRNKSGTDFHENNLKGWEAEVDLKRIFDDLKQIPQTKNSYDSVDLINFLFAEFDTAFYTDPRREKYAENKKSQFQFTTESCHQTLIQSPIMQLSMLSTISQLKCSNKNFYQITQQDKTHDISVINAIEFILSTLESFYYYSNMMEFFPKHRLFTLIGLSVGFLIEADGIIFVSTSKSIFDRSYQDFVLQDICKQVYELLKSKPNISQKITKEEIDFIELQKFKLKILDTEMVQGQEKINLDEFEENKLFYEQDTTIFEELCLSIPDTKYISGPVRSKYYNQSKLYDIYTGESLKGVFEQLDVFQELSQSEDFLILINFLKGNYQMLNQNEFFTSQYQQDANFFFGLLSINGCMKEDRGNIKAEDFQTAVSRCSRYFSSNKKSLSQILSLLLPQLPVSFSTAFDQYSPPEEATTSFINLCFSKSDDENKDLDALIDISSLSFENSLGDITQQMQLLSYSGLEQTSKIATFFFKKFLWSFEKTEMHCLSNNPNQINYFDFCNLSPNRAKALQEAQSYLWKVSTSYFHEKYLKTLPQNENKLSLKEYIKIVVFENNEINEDQIASLLQNILSNNWNFLLEKEINSLKPAFNWIFKSKQQDKTLETLKFLVLLKPEKCNIRIESQSQYYSLVNPQSIDEFQQIARDNNFKLFTSVDEQRSVSLLFSLANNSLLSTLNCLNTTNLEWKMDLKLLKEDERIKGDIKKIYNKEGYGKFLELLNKAHSKIFEEFKKQVNESDNPNTGQSIGFSLQQLFAWKNLQYVDWNMVDQYKKNLLEDPIEHRELITELKIVNKIPNLLDQLPFQLAQWKPYFNKDNLKRDFLQNRECRTLNLIFFELNSKKKQNSIYNIMQSFSNLKDREHLLNDSPEKKEKNLPDLRLPNTEYKRQRETETNFSPEDQNLNQKRSVEEKENDIIIKQMLKEESIALTSFMNGSFFLNQIVKNKSSMGRLIKYLSNVYFGGNECLKSGDFDKFIKNLLNPSDRFQELQFVEVILKEDDKYLQLFNSAIKTLFQIYFGTNSGTALLINEQESICKSVDELIKIFNKNILKIDQNIIDIVYAAFYFITNQKLASLEKNLKLEKQNFLVVNKPLLKIAFEHPDLSEFFFGTQNTGTEVSEKVEKMISTISGILQSILEKPFQSINDPDLIKEVLKLVKYAGKGTIDVSIIDDLFSVLNGEHKKIFSIMKKFELIDENKIQNIEKAYQQVEDMPIFKSIISKISGAVGGDSKNSDKIKEIIKRLKEGKATVQDVFLAVDNEGDSSGMISINEFQSFVRRLGMDLSRHRVNEIFAFIKNKKKVAASQAQKTEELQLNYEEFEKAFKYVNEKKTAMSLEKLGISPALLALSLGGLIIILILLFFFIFLGINAFTVGGTFGSIINSIIPMVAAGGVADSQENKKDKLKEEEIKVAASETQAIIHSDKL